MKQENDNNETKETKPKTTRKSTTKKTPSTSSTKKEGTVAKKTTTKATTKKEEVKAIEEDKNKKDKEIVVDKKEVSDLGNREIVEIKEGSRDVAETSDKGKKKKREKKVKLARIWKKKYSPRRFNRKILKKLYIPSDKELIKGYFVQEDNGNPKKDKFYIPLERQKKFTKKELKHLKVLAKQIKKQKGRVRLVPLIAALSVIFLILFFFLTMKNVLIKKVIKNLCETQFEARCDIAYLDLALLDSSFTVKGFEIANKDKPMKNIFSLDSLVIDFDLTQLLKKKFVAEEFSVEEIAVDSDRTYDGSLPPAKLKKIQEKKAQKAKEKEEKKQQIQQSFTNATNQVRDNVNNGIANIFNTFNPINILETCYKQLLIPGVVGKIEDTTVVLIDKWKTTPERVQAQVNNVQESANAIINFDYASIKDDPKLIKDMLDTFQDALKTIDGVKDETEALIAQLEDDVQTVTDLTEEVADSVQHDIDVTKKEIDKLTSFRLPSGQEFLASTIDIYGHELLGKYYPKLKEFVNYLLVLKDKQIPELPKREKKPKKEKKEVKRAEGRFVEFTRDYNPKVWIKNIKASGFNMALQITDIANDMNKTNKPCVATFKFGYKEITHGGRVVVDIRTETPNPLVYVEYTCDGTSFSHSDGIPGVPQIKTNANYTCSVTVNQDTSFALYGEGDFYNLELTSLPFEPPYIFNIYKNILGGFDSALVGLEIGISPSNGLTLRANTDLDDKIASALKDEIERQLSMIREAIEKEVNAQIKKFTDQAQVVVDKFKEIEKKVLALGDQLKEIDRQVRAKIDELENRQRMIQEKAEQAIIAGAEKAKQNLDNKIAEQQQKREEKREQNQQKFDNAVEEGKKKAEEAAGNAIKGFLGGFKK